MAIRITGGEVKLGDGFERTNLLAGHEGIRLDGAGEKAQLRFDASDLLVLPGIVDSHGDAFERQVMPRPGVFFPLDIALVDTDRQLATNGITTACHGITYSWEPGLRGQDNALAVIAALDATQHRRLVDTHVHLRYETFALDGEDVALELIEAGRIRVLAFNNHMEGIVKTTGEKRGKLAKMVERSGLSEADFVALVDRVWDRRDEVEASIARLAEAGGRAGIAMMSHDDRTPEERRAFRALGCRIAEFPMTEDTAREAVLAGEATVFGAPNVVRGGSHTGCPAAAEMASRGLASILASDYYYPAMAEAPFRLERDGILPLAKAWDLVSGTPARHLGFADRGVIAEGYRADLVIARRRPEGASIVATVIGGNLAFCAEPQRLSAD